MDGNSHSEGQQTLARSTAYEPWQGSFKDGGMESNLPATAMSVVDASFTQPSRISGMTLPVANHFHTQQVGEASSQESSSTISRDILAGEHIADSAFRRENESRRVLQSKQQPSLHLPNSSADVLGAVGIGAPRNGAEMIGFAASAGSTAPLQGAPLRPNEANRLKELEEVVHCFWLVSENRMTQVQEDLRTMTSHIKAAHFEQEQTSLYLSQIMPLQVGIAEKTVSAADDRRLIFGRIKSLEESMAIHHHQMQETLSLLQKEIREGLQSVLEQPQKGRKPPASKNAGAAAACKSAKTSGPANKRAAANSTTARKRKSQLVEVDADEGEPVRCDIQRPRSHPSHDMSPPEQRPKSGASISRNPFQLQDAQPADFAQSAPACMQPYQQVAGSLEMGFGM